MTDGLAQMDGYEGSSICCLLGICNKSSSRAVRRLLVVGKIWGEISVFRVREGEEMAPKERRKVLFFSKRQAM